MWDRTVAAEQFTYRIGDDGPHLHVVWLSGELDMAVAAKAREALAVVKHSTVVVDLSELTFLDATGLSALLQCREQLQWNGVEVKLRGAEGIVRRVFSTLGLGHLLTD